MKEVKTPKKPLAIYYTIVLLLLLLLNVVLVPWMNERQIKEVDYGTFMSMTEEKNIGKVDIESNQIIFTDKDNTQVYKTGLMDDSGLTERLYTAGAEFSSEIVEQGVSDPQLSDLLSGLLYRRDVRHPPDLLCVRAAGAAPSGRADGRRVWAGARRAAAVHPLCARADHSGSRAGAAAHGHFECVAPCAAV